MQKYRANYSFIDDCLDAYIVTACLHLLDLSDIDEISSRKQTLFDILPKEEQYNFILQIFKEILEKYIKIPDDLPTLSTEAAAMDTQKRQIEAMFDNRQQRNVCEVCDRQYKTANGLQRHLRDQHWWNITENTGLNIPQEDCDHIAVYPASFMKCAFLLRDTNDAYQMGDGNRILLNSKLQMLLSRMGNHSKYQFLLFRFMAYCYALLTPKMAYEYLWNCTANLQGNTCNNIPNDNLAHGSNATYKKC